VKTCKFWKNFIFVLVLVLMLAAGTMGSPAAETVLWDEDQEMSLTIELKKTTEVSTFVIYMVGEWEDGDYRQTETFAGFSGSFPNDRSVSGIVREAENLESYIEASGIQPDRTGITVDGKLTFSNLEAGLYLVSQPEADTNTITVTENPYLILLPSTDESTNEYLYDVTSIPKYISDDNTEDNTGDNTEDNTGDNTGGNTGDNTGGNTGDNTGGNTGDNTGGNTGDNTGENTGENTGDNTGENTGDNTGENTGENTGDNTGENIGENTGDNTGSNTENNTGGTGGGNSGSAGNGGSNSGSGSDSDSDSSSGSTSGKSIFDRIYESFFGGSTSGDSDDNDDDDEPETKPTLATPANAVSNVIEAGGMGGAGGMNGTNGTTGGTTSGSAQPRSGISGIEYSNFPIGNDDEETAGAGDAADGAADTIIWPNSFFEEVIDITYPSKVFAFISVFSATGCIALIRKRRIFKDDEDNH
jgi:hypothetical protein